MKRPVNIRVLFVVTAVLSIYLSIYSLAKSYFHSGPIRDPISDLAEQLSSFFIYGADYIWIYMIMLAVVSVVSGYSFRDRVVHYMLVVVVPLLMIVYVYGWFMVYLSLPGILAFYIAIGTLYVIGGVLPKIKKLRVQKVGK